MHHHRLAVGARQLHKQLEVGVIGGHRPGVVEDLQLTVRRDLGHCRRLTEGEGRHARVGLIRDHQLRPARQREAHVGDRRRVTERDGRGRATRLRRGRAARLHLDGAVDRPPRELAGIEHDADAGPVIDRPAVRKPAEHGRLEAGRAVSPVRQRAAERAKPVEAQVDFTGRSWVVTALPASDARAAAKASKVSDKVRTVTNFYFSAWA